MGKKSLKQKHKNKKKGTKRKKSGKPKVQDVYQDAEEIEEKGNFFAGGGEDVTNYDLPSDFEDEEISEDGAFTAEDYKTWGDIGNKSVDVEEELDDEDSDLANEEGAMSLSAMFDDSDEDAPQEKQAVPSRVSVPAAHFLDDEDEDEDDDDDDDDEDKHDSMLAAISARPRKKVKVQEVLAENGEESEFSTSQLGSLRLSDLIMGSDGTAGTRVKKQLASIRRNRKATTMPEPLSTIKQDRLLRKEGFQVAKEHVTRWDPVIAKNRNAEHLQFPLQDAPRQNTSTASMHVSFKPSTSLEKDLDAILDKYGYKEEALRKRETAQLEDRNLSPEEAQLKHEKLAKMKSLLFFHEMKMKRIKKIKSKTYRKLAKKRRMANEMSLESLAELDPEAAAERREKLARARIQERMSLQHKNTSKWAKRQLQYAKATGAKGRNMLQQQIQIGNQLKQKMKDADIGFAGEIAGEHQGSSDDDSQEDDDSRARRLGELESELKSGPAKASKGVFSMRFMQRAQEKQAAQAELELKQLAKEERQAREEAEREAKRANGEDEEEEEEEKEIENTDSKQRGRRKFLGSTLNTAARSHEEHESAPVKILPNSLQSATVGLSSGIKVGTSSLVITGATQPVLKPFEVEAFSSDSEEEEEEEEEETVFTISKGNAKDEKTPVKVGVLQVAPAQEEEEEEEEDEDSDDSDDSDSDKEEEHNPWAVGTSTNLRKEAREGTTKRDGKAKVSIDLSKPLLDIAADSDQAFNVLGAQGEQATLVRQVFADGADGEAAFATEKKQLVEKTLPKLQPTSIPGWGSWGGDGVVVSSRAKQRRKKREDRAKAKHAEEAGKILARRKDAKLDHVIISQKKDKKAMKYAVPILPHPYTSVAQYEAALGTPLGPEWNTLKHHQKANKPRILLKPGAIINPLKFNPKVHKKNSKAKAAKNREKRNKKYGKTD